MKIRTRIGEEAKARGFTGAEVARRLGWYRSNISAMDAGRRSISLKALERIAEVLGSSVQALIRVDQGSLSRPPFQNRMLNAALQERDSSAPDGNEKSWVHRVQLAWRRHYRSAKKAA